MAVPIKISTDRRLATDECCTQGHAACDYHAPEWCWVNDADAKDCLCRSTQPRPAGGATYKKWVDPKPKAPPTEMRMLAPQSWPQSCEGQCWERYHKGEDSERSRGIRDRCLETCSQIARQIAREGIYEM